ncbi:MAG TPA: c-type cytochrome domain-containing protein, partial [Armatimonadota bacterium]|nr:c-type cytochrome domain-containing protein [Armatimonadota bacterium]
MPLKPEFRLFDTNGTRQPLPVQFLLAAGWELLEHGSYDTVSLPLTVELEDTAIPALLAPGWRLDIQLDGAYSATAVSRPEELRRGEVRARPAPQTQSRLAADQIGRRWDFAGFSPETDGPDEGHNSTVTPIRPVGPVPAAFFMKSSLMRVVFRILIAPVLALPAFAALMSDAAEQKSPPAPAPRPAEVASKPDTKGAEFFETKIRPLLAAECVACHTGANAKGKLDLLSRESILKGGELGPALAPGDPGKSLLMQAVRFEGHLKMPPRGKLSPAQIQALSEWVERGAPWGVEKKQAVASPRKAGGAKAAAAAEPLWSLQPVREPKVPASAPASAKAGAAWARSPLDRFVLARL